MSVCVDYCVVFYNLKLYQVRTILRVLTRGTKGGIIIIYCTEFTIGDIREKEGYYGKNRNDQGRGVS